MKNQENEKMKTKFKAKNRMILEKGISEDFTKCRIKIEAESIFLMRKN